MLKKYNQVCDMLTLSRTGLQKLQEKDPTFPKPIKIGTTRQARAFFVLAELEAWLEAKKAERDEREDIPFYSVEAKAVQS